MHRSPLILFCPFWFRPGILSPFSRRDAGENSIPYSQHAPIFTKSFYRFYHSLCLYSPCPLPTYQPLSAIHRIQDVILRREYVTRGRAKRQTSNQGAWRDGSLRADEGQKGVKIFLNLPPNLPISTGFKWFPLCPSFIIERRDFLKEIREEMQILTT